ncbi:MAG: cell division protein ZapA [Prolixibacteraceae bacterium]|jgi:cell division protein ZapA (FtsZ GTPase activity inhibitor)|nr:cell division protein ZapA [Prolixibacteraceae bacterium]
MDDELSINITIAERRYPMRIKRSEEEKIRKAAKIINERILQYQERYIGKDNQDFLAMSGIQFVVQVLDLMKENDVEPFLNEVSQINDELTNYLSKT